MRLDLCPDPWGGDAESPVLMLYWSVATPPLLGRYDEGYWCNIGWLRRRPTTGGARTLPPPPLYWCNIGWLRRRPTTGGAWTPPWMACSEGSPRSPTQTSTGQTNSSRHVSLFSKYFFLFFFSKKKIIVQKNKSKIVSNKVVKARLTFLNNFLFSFFSYLLVIITNYLQMKAIFAQNRVKLW